MGLILTGVSCEDSGVATDDVDSTMELERPGEVKKKRCEATTVAKSGSESDSGSDERLEEE